MCVLARQLQVGVQRCPFWINLDGYVLTLFEYFGNLFLYNNYTCIHLYMPPIYIAKQKLL